MRATLEIDGDILQAAKVPAKAERKTLGQVLSKLVRRGLAESAAATPLASAAEPSMQMEGARLAAEGDQDKARTRRG
jgi:hypothetical protein